MRNYQLCVRHIFVCNYWSAYLGISFLFFGGVVWYTNFVLLVRSIYKISPLTQDQPLFPWSSLALYTLISQSQFRFFRKNSCEVFHFTPLTLPSLGFIYIEAKVKATSLLGEFMFTLSSDKDQANEFAFVSAFFHCKLTFKWNLREDHQFGINATLVWPSRFNRLWT